jgi:hypothetical protein
MRCKVPTSHSMSVSPSRSAPTMCRRGRQERGLITRAERCRSHFRTHVDAAVATFSVKNFDALTPIIGLGLDHEHRHQGAVANQYPRASSFRLQGSGALGEYNGNFMAAKWYYGLSLATPSGHSPTYRNFFSADSSEGSRLVEY